MTKPFIPRGYTHKLMIYGPEKNSKAYRVLRKIAKKAGWSDKDIAVYPILPYEPDKFNMAALREGRPYLLRSIELVNPKYIIVCGVEALHAILNLGKGSIKQYRGIPLPIPGYPNPPVAYVTYNPESIINGGYHLENRVLEDLSRPKWSSLPSPENTLPKGSIDILGLDFEYNPKGHLLTVGISDGTRAGAYDIEDDGVEKYRGWPNKVGRLLANSRNVSFHNLGADIDYLVSHGLATNELCAGIGVLDSYLLMRMHDENRLAGYDVETLLRNDYNIKPWKCDTELYNKTDATTWPPKLRRERCRKDAWATAKISHNTLPNVTAEFPYKCIALATMIAASIHRVCIAGAMVNMKTLDKRCKVITAETEKYARRLKNAARRHGMKEYDPTNNNHTRELMRKTKIPLKEKTKTGLLKVDKDVLKPLADKYKLVANVLEHSKRAKLLSTWYGSKENSDAGVVRLVKPYRRDRGFIFFNLQQLGTDTGRRSAREPNSQNWPEETRQIICSRWKGGRILNVDYSKLEPTIMALVTGEEKMAEYFTSGKGYIGIGEEFFGKTVEKGTKEYTIIKSIVLGIGYGMGAWKLAHDLWYKAGVKLNSIWKTHVEEAGKLIRKYLRMYKKLARWMRAKEQEMLETGQVICPDGWVRHLPCPLGKATVGYRHLRNQAINTPIQHMASMVTGSALVDVENELNAAYGMSLVEYHQMLIQYKGFPQLRTVIFNEVHDSLVSDLHPEYRKRDKEIIVETMKAIPLFKKYMPDFPLYVDVEWNEAPVWRSK